MRNINKGEIYWGKVNGNQIPHPYVIIENTIIDYNNSNIVTVCGITTNMKKKLWPGNILLESGVGNLPKNSIIDISQIYIIEKEELGEFIGKIDNVILQQITSGIKLIDSLQKQHKKF